MLTTRKKAARDGIGLFFSFASVNVAISSQNSLRTLSQWRKVRGRRGRQQREAGSTGITGIAKAHQREHEKQAHPAQLAYESIVSPNIRTNPTQSAVILHGIAGNKKNWRTFAKRLTSDCPQWRIYLVDLRGHGKSPSMAKPHTVASCAEDVIRLLNYLDVSARIVCGHSFGGKVALEYLKQRKESGLEVPRHTWVLDSLPGRVADIEQYMDSNEQSVTRVIEHVKRLREITSRDEVLRELEGQGFTKAMAGWMTTNLSMAADGSYSWNLDLDVIDDLVQDYLNADYLPFLQDLDSSVEVNLLRAERNKAWTNEVLGQIDSLREQKPALHLNMLENAGHWVHVDNPWGLLDLLKQSFKSPV